MVPQERCPILPIVLHCMVTAIAAAGDPPPTPPAISPLPNSIAKSSETQSCERRCANAGHCCPGSTSSNNNPSCAQGCLVAQYYRLYGAGGATDLVKDQCQKLCKNIGNAHTCSWAIKNLVPDSLTSLTNCGTCPDVGDGHYCDAADGAGGQECVLGCTYFLFPAKMVCGFAQSGSVCATPTPPPAPVTRLQSAGGPPPPGTSPSPAPKPQKCDKKDGGCTDWFSCSNWCQVFDEVGCCSWDEYGQQCEFQFNSTGLSPAPHSSLGSGDSAALCGQVDPSNSGTEAAQPFLTWGWYFNLCFGGLLAIYFAAGIAYNYKRRGARGSDVIPNKEFWKDLPFLFKDGVVFAASGVAAKFKGKDSYDAV